MQKEYWQLGERVTAGEGADEDVGVILELRGPDDGREAFVGWDSGVSTWIPVCELAEA